jgi:hypothetical protein
VPLAFHLVETSQFYIAKRFAKSKHNMSNQNMSYSKLTGIDVEYNVRFANFVFFIFMTKYILNAKKATDLGRKYGKFPRCGKLGALTVTN